MSSCVFFFTTTALPKLKKRLYEVMKDAKDSIQFLLFFTLIRIRNRYCMASNWMQLDSNWIAVGLQVNNKWIVDYLGDKQNIHALFCV